MMAAGSVGNPAGAPVRAKVLSEVVLLHIQVARHHKETGPSAMTETLHLVLGSHVWLSVPVWLQVVIQCCPSCSAVDSQVASMLQLLTQWQLDLDPMQAMPTLAVTVELWAQLLKAMPTSGLDHPTGRLPVEMLSAVAAVYQQLAHNLLGPR